MRVMVILASMLLMSGCYDTVIIVKTVGSGCSSLVNGHRATDTQAGGSAAGGDLARAVVSALATNDSCATEPNEQHR